MTLAILGVGVMGETILSGLIAAGWDPASIRGTTRRGTRTSRLTEKYGIALMSNQEAVRDADTIVVAVKPQDVPDVLSEISGHLDDDVLVISLAAGLATASLEAHLPPGTSVVRVMPNTPAKVGEGMSAVSPGTHASHDQIQRACSILEAVGKVQVVPEKYQDAVTAISGSGPAYIMFVAEAMIDAGVMLGLPRGIATDLVVQTVFGSAKLLRDSGEHPTVLRENVTSPGGTTTAALRAFEDHRVKAAFMDAMEAACRRSEDLGKR